VRGEEKGGKPKGGIKMVKKYHSKKTIVEAIQWKGNNIIEVGNFLREGKCDFFIGKEVTIFSPDGDMIALIGDFIVKISEDDFYPCNQNLFEKIYGEEK
jgi:hypothetical protein